MSQIPTQTDYQQRQHYSLTAILQLILVATIFNAQVVLLSATPLVAPETALSDNGDVYPEKRSWQSLKGGWGKRTLVLDEDRMPLSKLGNPADPIYTVVYLTNGDTLQRLVNQRRLAGEMSNYDLNDVEVGDNESGAAIDAIENDNLLLHPSELEALDDILHEKRTWKNLNVGWGKRRNEPTWNKFRGSWGKREPGWNNLKGMWGKRAAKDFPKVHASVN